MLPDVFRLRIVILHPRGGERLVTVLPTDRVVDVIARALADAGVEPDAYADWELCFAGTALPRDRLIRGLIPLGTTPTPLTLRPASPGDEFDGGRKSAERAPSPAATRSAPGAAPAPTATYDTDHDITPVRGRDEDDEFDDEDEDEDDSEFEVTLNDGEKTDDGGTLPSPALGGLEAMPAPGTAPGALAGSAPAKAAPRTEKRRATVRYYSRMNPDRVFPLLVMLTREEVEKVVQKHVAQKATGPITIAKDVPLEIEPVLPGCVCHPPRVTTKVGGGDEVFTFHVVPHVLGNVTGARVLLRQDHAPLAEIELDIRVVQRTMVVVSGLSAVALPAASAVMQNFGVDFTPKGGASPYLAAMNFLFSQVSPLALTAALVALTGVFWWFTRPKGRDVFWDISTKPPGGK